MRTCNVLPSITSGLAIQSYPNAYANVGEAGELTIMWEINVGTDAEPRYSSRVNAIYAPGTWLSVTYEEA